MRVAIYVRVSTDMQAEDGYSLDGQIERCKAYCTSQGWDIVEIYVEEGESAKDLNRTELTKLLNDAENGLFDVLLVYKLDRLTRSVRDLHTILDNFERLGIKFRSATEVYDTTTAMGKLFITIVAALAEWERGNLAERVRFGMETLVKEGKWHGGPVPVGYSWENGMMHIVAEESNTLRKLRELYMSGLGFGATSKALNTLKMLNRGNPWSAQSVWYVLDNPFYAGKIRYGSKKKNGKYASRKKEERVDVIWSDSGFPTIFSWGEYQEHNARMKRRQFYGTSRKREYWFSGVIRCARCGNAMIGRPYRNKRIDGSVPEGVVNYICSWRSQQKGCDMPILRQSVAVEMIMGHIKNIRMGRQELSAAAEEIEKVKTDRSEELGNARKELAAVTERRKKWQYMFAEDLMTEADFRSRKREEDEKEKLLLSIIEEMKADEVGINHEFAKLLYELPEFWENADDIEKKEAMQTIFESIYFECEVKSGKGTAGKGRALPFKITSVNFN